MTSIVSRGEPDARLGLALSLALDAGRDVVAYRGGPVPFVAGNAEAHRATLADLASVR